MSGNHERGEAATSSARISKIPAESVSAGRRRGHSLSASSSVYLKSGRWKERSSKTYADIQKTSSVCASLSESSHPRFF